MQNNTILNYVNNLIKETIEGSITRGERKIKTGIENLFRGGKKTKDRRRKARRNWKPTVPNKWAN
jgi:hypothetical protein